LGDSWIDRRQLEYALLPFSNMEHSGDVQVWVGKPDLHVPHVINGGTWRVAVVVPVPSLPSIYKPLTYEYWNG
jgi:hypothetical protein